MSFSFSGLLNTGATVASFSGNPNVRPSVCRGPGNAWYYAVTDNGIPNDTYSVYNAASATTPIKTVTVPSTGLQPVLVQCNGTLYLFYASTYNNNMSMSWNYISTVDGTTWSDASSVPGISGDWAFVYQLSAASHKNPGDSSETLYIAFSAETGLPGSCTYFLATLSGSTWSSLASFNIAGSTSIMPQITPSLVSYDGSLFVAAASDSHHIAIFYLVYLGAQAHFSRAAKIPTKSTETVEVGNPILFATSNGLYCMYTKFDPNDPHIEAYVSQYGLNWNSDAISGTPQVPNGFDIARDDADTACNWFYYATPGISSNPTIVDYNYGSNA